MAFIDDLGNAITDVAKTVSNKTSEIVEVTKLNNKISDETKAANHCYIQIGKMIFEKYKANELNDESFSELCQKISEHEEKIADYKVRVDEAKGTTE